MVEIRDLFGDGVGEREVRRILRQDMRLCPHRSPTPDSFSVAHIVQRHVPEQVRFRVSDL